MRMRYGTVEDGDSIWIKCSEACTMELVRPGKVQCVTLQQSLESIDPRPPECPDRSDIS